MSVMQRQYLDAGFDPRAAVQETSPWQEIIHGQTRSYRYACVDWLMENGKEERAVGFALCGKGDRLQSTSEGLHVRAKRCGHPCCPRCSRSRGLKHLRRVQEYLRSKPHGALFHVVLTQQVDPAETLETAQERFEGRFTKWLRLYRERIGMTAALATTHVSFSMSEEGWHYHKHVIVQTNLASELAARRLDFAGRCWAEIKRTDGDTRACEAFVRLLCNAGQPLAELDEGQGDLWCEAKDATTQCIQYACRDVCQGVESWNLEGCLDRVKELFAVLPTAKLRRFYGEWRKPLPREEVKAEPTKKAADGPREFHAGDEDLGTVDAVLFAAGRGEPWAMDAAKGLLACVNNKGGVGRRLVAVVGRFVHHSESVVLVA